MMDFALPDSMDSIRNQVIRRQRRPARKWFFLSGVVIGLIWGFALTMALRDLPAKSAKPIPVWNTTAFTYVGYQDGRYFIQNRSGKDYRLDPDRCLVMRITSLGLIPTDSKPDAVFIPADDAGGIGFNPALEGELVLFDHGGKHRIDLRGGAK